MRSQSRVCKSIPLDGKTNSTPAQSNSFCQAFLHAYTCIRIHIYIHIYVCQTLMLLSVKAFSCPHSYIYTYKNKNHEDRSYFLLHMKELNHGKELWLQGIYKQINLMWFGVLAKLPN